tara:strand:- start:259 stop:435 length:177 start_codon:yes stop_codon:yes gene_type:complete
MIKKPKKLSVRIDDETFEFLEKVAKSDERTPSFIVRKMIDSYKHLTVDAIINKLQKKK